MASAVISQQLRLILEQRSDALPLAELLANIDLFCVECTSSEQLLIHFQEELQTLYRAMDHSSLYQLEVFLSVLRHLSKVLSSTSIISTWWYLVLRPALRNPKLPILAVNYAKEITHVILHKIDASSENIVKEFRWRLFSLYLLGLFSEGSAGDVLEWALADEEQREEHACWKSNLEDILLTFACEQPADFLDEINNCFSTPSYRLQLLTLFNIYTSHKSFPPCASILVNHPFMTSLLLSLFSDNSAAVCNIGITIFAKLLPVFAIHVREELKAMLPKLLIILARIICWKDRPAALERDKDIPAESDIIQDLESEVFRSLNLRPDLHWERLESILLATAAPAPVPNPLFCALYFLFPCNVFEFYRAPIAYLNANQVECPYTVPWEDILDEDEFRSKSEPLLRGHVLNPSMLWRSAETELTQPPIWSSYDVARVATECRMLDAQRSALAARMSEQTPRSWMDLFGGAEPASSERPTSEPTPVVHPINLEPMTQISLKEMVATSIALKSGRDVNIDKTTDGWPSGLFTASASLSSRQGQILPLETAALLEAHSLPPRVGYAMSLLQYEILLLRNELNFELWISRENAAHICRLYQTRILSKNAEAERQALYNKLRKYRAQVIELENELKENKQQASSVKHKFAEYNEELHKKLSSLREQKKSWITEAVTLREKEKEAHALFESQRRLLAAANKELFELQTQKKERQHKIDRLRDYERQIDQHTKIQQLWGEDFAKFNEREEQMQVMANEYKKLELRLESYEKSQAELGDSVLRYKRQAQALELRLAAMKSKSTDASRRMGEADLVAFSDEKARLSEANAKLQEKNADLRDEVEELRAMVEVLKGQVSGRRGVISNPRSSPIISPSISPRISFS